MNASPSTDAARPPPAATCAPQGGEAAITCGVLELGSAQIAVPIDALREVIPCPPQFSGLPVAAPGLLGAVNVRGKVVPVLDPRVAMGLAPSAGTGLVIVLLRHENLCIGLLTGGVRGLTRVLPSALNTFCTSDNSLLFSGSFERAEDGQVVSVLDPAAVMRLPGLPLLREPAGRATSAGGRPAENRLALMLLRCGGLSLAIDVADVHATLPRVTLAPSAMQGDMCRGVIEHGGTRVPAVDPLALMALGRLPSVDACQALLLRFAGGLVALLVDQVIDIVRVSPAEFVALPAISVRRPELFRAMLHVPQHGEHLVLRTGLLHREPALLLLATLNTAARPAGDAAAASPGPRTEGALTAGTGGAASAPSAASNNAYAALNGASDRAVITFDIGSEYATRLSLIHEVMPLPPHSSPHSEHPAVMGVFTHRDRAVVLVCLASQLGAGPVPDPAFARVMLIEEGGTWFGFVVARLCHIEQAVWERPGTSRPGAAAHPLGRHAVGETGEGERRRTLHIVDLKALARELLGPPAEAEAPRQLEEAAAV